MTYVTTNNSTNNNTGGLNIHRTYVTTNNSTNNNIVFFFYLDLKIVYYNIY